jgi:molybdenum cofactor synthesis domain-containing protein
LQTVAILAVGTEVTQGQIVNSNAATLSHWLCDLGYDVVFHHTVPDDDQAIFAGLNLCADAADLILVTGGLGPTTDDFTRNIVSNWLQAPLEFDERSWQRIEEMMSRRGIPVALANRQQCYYPKGAKILVNAAGTASGFAVSVATKEVFVLPGPPDEIRAIWYDHMYDLLAGKVPSEERTDLKIWSCMGISEAELGERVESALAGSSLKIGYRAHSPLIDVKLWIPRKYQAESEVWIAKLEAVVEPYLVSTQGEDLAEIFLKSLPKGIQVDIHDVGTGGLVAGRVAGLLRGKGDHKLASRFHLVTQWDSPVDYEGWVGDVLQLADPAALTFVVCGPSSTGTWVLGYGCAGEVRVDGKKLGFKGDILKRRGPAYVCELAFIGWTDFLRGQA